MKLFLKFNHKAKCLLEALDSPKTMDECNAEIRKLINDYFDDDNLTSKSELAEMVHDRIDYSAILYMATQYVLAEVEKQMILKTLRDDEIF